jgi:hypothetical protein
VQLELGEEPQAGGPHRGEVREAGAIRGRPVVVEGGRIGCPVKKSLGEVFEREERPFGEREGKGGDLAEGDN